MVICRGRYSYRYALSSDIDCINYTTTYKIKYTDTCRPFMCQGEIYYKEEHLEHSCWLAQEKIYKMKETSSWQIPKGQD